MWTVQQVSEFIERRLGYVLMRPLMYGGNAEAVEMLLHSYIELWSQLNERYEDYDAARSARASALNANAMGFVGLYRRKHPKASELAAANYVALQYKKIIEQLQLPVPWKQINAERKRILRNLKSNV